MTTPEHMPMKGWLVLYTFGFGDVLPKYYKTEKQAHKFADEHNRLRTDSAFVINVEDLLLWHTSGVGELERMFRL